MEVVHERICGIDVHQASLVCCIVEGVGRQPKTHFKSFGTMTEDVSQLVAWLKEHGVQEVVMEATGIYWKPVYALLEEHAHIIVANPQHVKAIAGRKTDKKDSQWLAELARVGLVHNSFVPAQDMRDLRELVRHRASVTRAHVTQRNQIIRPLEWSNIKLSSVLSDVFGTSGRRLLEALVVGTQSAEQMSQLVDVRVKADRGKIARALTGLLSSAARWLLGQKLDHLRQLDGALREVDAKISSVVEAKGDWQIAKALLLSIPGICATTAHVILGELGADTTVFGSAAQAAAWAGLCPGNNESAGKTLSSTTRKGNPHLKTTLCQAARSASNKKNSVFQSTYKRLRARIGSSAATVAVAHKLMRVIFAILKNGTPYEEPTPPQPSPAQATRRIERALKELAALGYPLPLPGPPAMPA